MSGTLRTDNKKACPMLFGTYDCGRGWRPPRLPKASAVDVCQLYLEDILGFKLLHNQRMHKDKFMTVSLISNVFQTRAKTIIFVKEPRHANSFVYFNGSGCMLHDLPEYAIFRRRYIPESSCAILMHCRQRLSQKVSNCVHECLLLVQIASQCCKELSCEDVPYSCAALCPYSAKLLRNSVALFISHPCP